MTNNCLFCQLVAGTVPSYKILENEQALAFLDIYPQTPGHILIIPKEHSLNILDTSDKNISAVNIMAKQVCLLLKKSLKVNNFVVKSHHGKLAGQEIDHFHVHVIPCYDEKSRLAARKAASDQDLKQLQKTITSHL